MPIDQLTAQLDRLSAFDAGPFPVVSLYLDLRSDEHGRDRFDQFLRKELSERVVTYAAGAPERDSLERDAARIREYVTTIDRSLNGLALFASSGAGLFEAVPLAVPIEGHRLYISNQPHLFPLARLLDQYPRYVALLADTHSARIFVFAANELERTDQIEGVKTKRHKMGGWSQARYQRHIENYHLHHAKEIVDALSRIVREEEIEQVILAGDEVIVPLLREQMPKDVAERIVDVLKLDVRTPQRDVLDRSLEALKEHDAVTDRERVDDLLGAYRSGGLGCAGMDAVRRAFELGQVDELLVPASADAVSISNAGGHDNDRQLEPSPKERALDELVALAHQTSARIRVIEDTAQLAPLGGVGAFLRFRV
jgi:peptide chain release factor subunit 1